MAKIRNVLMNKVFPKLFELEENPTCTLLRTTTRLTNPFDSEDIGEYNESIEAPCIFSEEPETITSGNNIIVKQALFIYLREIDVGEVKMTDRLIFRNRRYKPVEIQYLFGLWKVKVVRE